METEALLLGTWKNVEDLEESLTLKELEMVVKAARDKEHRQNVFMAALKGINLDEGNDAKDKVEEMKRKVEREREAQRSGISEEVLELAEFGLDVETE